MKFCISIFALLLAMNAVAQADLTLKLIGAPGSNVIFFEASGSVVNTESYKESGSTTTPAFVPSFRMSGDCFFWSTLGSNIGNALVNGLDYSSSGLGANLSLSSNVSYKIDGEGFDQLDRIRILGSDNDGEDDIRLLRQLSFYPELPSGSALSWSGAGHFNISGDSSFDDVFISGTYFQPIDDGNLIFFIILSGDINCDNKVDLLDVAPFVELLSYGRFSEKADVNRDGTVDLLDVTPFVDLLTSE